MKKEYHLGPAHIPSQVKWPWEQFKSKVKICGHNPMEFIQLSIENRVAFLRDKKLEWENNDGRKRNRIIADLLSAVPSHLSVQWILDEVVKWRNDFARNENYLREAFLKKAPDSLNEGQKKKRIENALLDLKIEIISLIEDVSNAEAYRICVLNSNDESLPDDAEAALKQRVKRYRYGMKKRVLPDPYFGLDVVKRDNVVDFYAPPGSKFALDGYVDNYEMQVSHTPGVFTDTDKPYLTLPLPFKPEFFDKFLKAKHPHAF